jgi:hypothetical protein
MLVAFCQLLPSRVIQASPGDLVPPVTSGNGLRRLDTVAAERDAGPKERLLPFGLNLPKHFCKRREGRSLLKRPKRRCVAEGRWVDKGTWVHTQLPTLDADGFNAPSEFTERARMRLSGSSVIHSHLRIPRAWPAPTALPELRDPTQGRQGMKCSSVGSHGISPFASRYEGAPSCTALPGRCQSCFEIEGAGDGPSA